MPEIFVTFPAFVFYKKKLYIIVVFGILGYAVCYYTKAGAIAMTLGKPTVTIHTKEVYLSKLEEELDFIKHLIRKLQITPLKILWNSKENENKMQVWIKNEDFRKHFGYSNALVKKNEDHKVLYTNKRYGNGQIVLFTIYKDKEKVETINPNDLL